MDASGISAAGLEPVAHMAVVEPGWSGRPRAGYLEAPRVGAAGVRA
jgi:hypothetical protein